MFGFRHRIKSIISTNNEQSVHRPENIDKSYRIDVKYFVDILSIHLYVTIQLLRPGQIKVLCKFCIVFRPPVALLIQEDFGLQQYWFAVVAADLNRIIGDS